MIRRTIFVLLVFTLTFSMQLVYAQDYELTDTFDDPALLGWEHTPNAYVENGVLRVEGGGFAAYGGFWKDIEMITHARRLGDDDLVVQYSWTDEGVYLVRVGPEFVALYRQVGEDLIELGNHPQTVPPEEWFELIIFTENGNHTVHINGEPVIQANDPDPLQGGGIGFLADDGVIVEVQDVTLFSIGGGAPQEQPTEHPQDSPSVEDAPHPGELTWVRTGGPPGGLGYDIRYNFDDPTIWYATDNFAGLHISTDNGLTWELSTTGIPPQAGPSGDQIPIFCLTVDPHDPQILWTGTDVTGNIYKSVDGGRTWVEKDNGITTDYEQLTFRGFTVDPRSSDIVYAMGETTLLTEGDAIWVPKGGIIFKTTDGGENWQLLWDGGIPTSSLARYMWIDPRDPDVLFVSTGIFDRGAVGQVPDGEVLTSIDPFGGLGILKSTDGGQTWRELNEDNGLNSLYVGSLYMHPENPDILLAGTGHNVPEAALAHFMETGSSPLGVYRTEDGGENWTQVITPPQDRIGEVYSSVEFCPNHPEIAYAGTGSTVYRSEDAGLTWTEAAGGPYGWGPPGVVAGSPIDMQCDPRDPDRIFANNYQGGNFLSKDGGMTWQNASQGYTGAQVIAVVVDPRNAARVYASGRNGVWRSDDGGTTWIGLRKLEEGYLSPEWGGAAIDPTNPDRVLVGGEPIVEMRDDGTSWQSYRMPPNFGPFIGTLVFAPSDPLTVYAGAASHNTMVHSEIFAGMGFARSSDGGITWEYAAGEQFENGPTLGIAVDPTDAQIVFAATQYGVFKTTNGGGDWAIVPGLPGGASHSVAINPEDPQQVFAGIDMIGFYLSQDGGNTWNQLSAGLEPNGSHRDIVFDPSNAQAVYVADLMSGVYRSEDGGQTWMKINTGLLNRAVTGLGVSGDGLHLYAATNGAGVFRLDLNGEPPTPVQGIAPEQPVEPQLEVTPVEEAEEEPVAQPEISVKEDEGGAALPCAGGAIVPIVFVVTLSGFSKRGRARKNQSTNQQVAE